MTRTALGRLTLAVVVVVGALGLRTPAAVAAEGLELTAQAPITTLATDFAYTARFSPAAPGTALRTTLYERLTTRSAFDRTAADGPLGAALSRVTTDVAPGSTTITATIPLVGSATEGPALNATQAGVYPVRVELLSNGSPTETAFTTYLVTAPADESPVREPLAVASVIPVVDTPAYRADGNPELAAVATRTADGRLGRLAAGLARNAATPMTTVLGGETLDSWRRLAVGDPAVAAGLAQLRAGTATGNRVPGPFVPIDAPSMRSAGLDATVAREFTRGPEAVAAALEQQIDLRTAAPFPVDEGTLETLGARGVDQLILDPTSLRPLAARLTPARPFLVEGPNRQFRAVALDPGISAAATPDANGPIASAQRVLAGLALVALEAPGVTRGLAFTLPTTIDAPTAYYDTLLAGLRASPYLRPVTTTQLLADVPTDATTAGPLVRTLVAPELTTPNVTANQLARARERADALATLLAPEDNRTIQARNAPLVAPTSLWTGQEGQRRAADELTAVDGFLAEAGAAIRAPSNRTFQLTGKRDRIPLTFVNDSDQTVDVKLRFDGSRISFPEGQEQVVTLPANKSTTIPVEVEPRTSGKYPFTLTMLTTSGDVQLSETTLRVNASVVSNVGLYLAIGAGLFLAVWWAHYVWKRRRRPQPPTPVAVADPVEQSA